MPKGITTITLIGLSAAIVLVTACGSKTKLGSKTESTTNSRGHTSSYNPNDASSKTKNSENAQVIDTEGIKQRYPELYCKRVVELQVQLRADVTEQLKYFCPDGKPSPAMLTMRQRLLDAANGRTAVEIISEPDSGNPSYREESEYVIAWGYRVGIRPFEVKARPLYEFIANDLNSDGVVMTGTQSRRPDGEVDSGLHLWSVDMTYDLKVRATNGIDLTNVRKTQYNLYQVESGNEEMGFGVEALTEPADFSTSTMLNLSFNDGQGFNDGKGQAIILNILHIKLQNKGFPETAAMAINKIANFLADSMYEGLSK